MTPETKAAALLEQGSGESENGHRDTSRLDFEVSSRGWCYILEEHGLSKGDFDDAQELIAECRRQRLLPMDIVAEDGARAFDNLEDLDADDPEDRARSIVS